MEDKINKMFNDIYEETYHDILRYVVSKCDNLNYVEEIVQDTYLNFYKQLKKDDSYIEKHKQFLMKLVKNELFKYYSLKNKVKTILNISLESGLDIIDNLPDEDINIEEDIAKEHDLKNIWKTIKKQNLITQKIITLYYLEEMKLSEIANFLNIKESTVKSILYRGIKKIKNELMEGEK